MSRERTPDRGILLPGQPAGRSSQRRQVVVRFGT